MAVFSRAETHELAGPIGRLWPTLAVRYLKAPETD